MRFVDEYRDADAVHALARAIRRLATRPHTLMEICGGQTHAIVKFGLDDLLPPGITLVHGPGCPVCVTPVEIIDQALAIAARPGVIFCSFGDMLRVPGTHGDLFSARAEGADVRIVYSPLDAVKLAEATPDRDVVFFAVGFETTAPANALAVRLARERALHNFSILCAHVLVPPAMEAILSSPGCRIDAFLAAGHVCTVMGYEAYEPIALRYRVPIVVTGFEPLDILQGIHLCVKQLEEGRAEVENQYARSVRRAGNPSARGLIGEIFEVIPRKWRGLGELAQSGLGLRETYRRYDAARRFGVEGLTADESTECMAGAILQGQLKPHECPAFGTRCTPDSPLGAPMVSSEGACAAYYRYRKDAS
jgi:hydrogenase expression/formation protein HypD